MFGQVEQPASARCRAMTDVGCSERSANVGRGRIVNATFPKLLIVVFTSGRLASVRYSLCFLGVIEGEGGEGKIAVKAC